MEGNKPTLSGLNPCSAISSSAPPSVLGALLPIAVLALAVAVVAAPFSGNPLLVFTTVVVQLGYGLFAVYWFGWLAALLIRTWQRHRLALRQIHPHRLVLSPAVGLAATALAFGGMLVGGGLSALPSFILFCVGGVFAAGFSAFLVALGDVGADGEPVPA